MTAQRNELAVGVHQLGGHVRMSEITYILFYLTMFRQRECEPL